MQQDEGNIQSGTTARNGRGGIIIISGWILISNLHCYTDCFAALMKNEHQLASFNLQIHQQNAFHRTSYVITRGKAQ